MMRKIKKEEGAMRYEKQIFLFVSLIFLSVLSLNCSSRKSGSPVANKGITETGDISSVLNLRPAYLRFQDGFEVESGWGSFEEVVGGNTCYAKNRGAVVRSTDAAYEGLYSLLVWANKAGSQYSNHVIAQKKLSNSGITGVWEYRLYAYIPVGVEDQGQTGPEFSVQSTRQIAPGDFRTHTVGLQYRRTAENWKVWGDWAVWHNAQWVKFHTQPLQTGQWYLMVLRFDYTKNRYISWHLKGVDVDLTIDMSGYTIAPESKWSEEALWVTAEAENLWHDCTDPSNVFSYKVYYDNVRLVSR